MDKKSYYRRKAMTFNGIELIKKIMSYEGIEVSGIFSIFLWWSITITFFTLSIISGHSVKAFL